MLWRVKILPFLSPHLFSPFISFDFYFFIVCVVHCAFSILFMRSGFCCILEYIADNRSLNSRSICLMSLISSVNKCFDKFRIFCFLFLCDEIPTEKRHAC